MKLFSFVTNEIKGTLGQWFVPCRFVARSRAIHSLHTSALWGRHSNEIYVLMGQREHFEEVCQTSLAAVFFLTSG
jgi:hypothetical protein